MMQMQYYDASMSEHHGDVYKYTKEEAIQFTLIQAGKTYQGVSVTVFSRPDVARPLATLHEPTLKSAHFFILQTIA
jgi:hypothetical protein